MTIRTLYDDVTIGGNSVDIKQVEVSEGYKQTTATFNVELEDAAGLEVNDEVEIDIGYTDSHGVIFEGYVDNIQYNRLPGTYTLTGRDILKLAQEHYIVSTDLENPWSRNNISAEDLVEDLLAEASITSYSGAATGFTFGVQNDAEFNLMASWDAISTICRILAYNCWAENGVVYFDRVFPIPDVSASQAFTVGDSGNIIVIEYGYSTDNLRNKVVVFGLLPIYAEASIASPYLPDGFYKTAIVSSELIDSQSMADDSAAYNLDLYNKLTESARIDAPGIYTVRCRDTISITEPFTGMDEDLWFVYSITHTLGPNGYTMSISLSR